MNKLTKSDKIFYFGVLPFMLLMMITFLILFINCVKIENKKRYKELPNISVVEEVLEKNLITNEPFSYIRYEFLDEDTLAYYFVFDEPQLYYKVIYNFKISTFVDKRWLFWKVLPSWKEEAHEEHNA